MQITFHEFARALGFAVRAVRKNKKLSQREVRLRAGINSQRLISEIELGRRNMKFTTMFKICEGLQVRLYTVMKLTKFILSRARWVVENKVLFESESRKSVTRSRRVSDFNSSESNFNLALGHAIKDIRIAKGLSRTQFTQRVGFRSKRAVSEYELGLRCPRLITFFKISQCLQVKPSHIASLFKNKCAVERSTILMVNKPSILRGRNE